jgi:hypothetical protein
MLNNLITKLQSERNIYPAFIFSLFSSSIFFTLLLAFPFYDLILVYKPGISNFSNHMISAAAAANIDISTRIASYLIFILGFSLLTVIVFALLYFICNNRYKDGTDKQAIHFIRDTSLIGIAVVIVSMFTIGKDLAAYFVGVAVLLGWIFILLRDDRKDFDVLIWAILAAVPFALFIAQFSKYLEFIPYRFDFLTQYLNAEFPQQIPQVVMLTVFMGAWVVISIMFFIILPKFLNSALKSNSKWLDNYKFIYLICGIPFLFTGIFQSFLLELSNILDKNFALVLGHPYRMYAIVMLASAVIAALLFILFKFVLLKKEQMDFSRAGNLIYVLYMPVVLITLAFLVAQPARMISAGSEFFEMANHGLGVDHLFRYGSIPMIDTFDAHGISNQIFAYFYSIFNGYEPWSAFLYYNYWWVFFYIIPLFYILRKLIGPTNSFFIIVCFPLVTNLINGYYLLAGIVAICIIHIVPFHKRIDYYIFWITAFLLCIYRFDMGTASLLGGLVAYFISSIVTKEKIEYLKFFLPGVITGGMLLVLFVSLCMLKGISPMDRILEIISLGEGNLGGAYTTTGDSKQLVYVMGYYILPLFVLTSALWMVVKLAILNRRQDILIGEGNTSLINRDAFIMFIFFTAFFIFNAQRGIVRHSFEEGIITIILGTIPLAILAFSVIDRKPNMLKFLSAALMIIILINVNVTSFKGLGTPSLLSNAITSPSYQEQYTKAYAFNGSRVKGPVMPADAQNLKNVLDTVLTPQETYFDFTSMNYFHALVGRRNPVYVDQSPLLIQTDTVQKYALQEIKNAKPPIVLVPILGKYWSHWDGITVDYKYYMIAEYIYENYEPLIRLPMFDVYCLRDRREAYNNKLKDNGLIGKPGLQTIDNQPEIWLHDLGQIPRLWAEKDGNKTLLAAPSLPVPEKDVSTLFTDTSNVPLNTPMYLLLQLDSSMEAVAMIDISNSQSKLAEYKLDISKGNHGYAIRLSTDYHWWNNIKKNVSVVTDQPVDINKFCFVSAESSTYYDAPKFEVSNLARVEGTTPFYVDVINDRPLNQQTSPIVINAQTEKTIVIAGWAVDQKAATASGGVVISVDGKKDIFTWGMERHDVAEYLKNTNYRYAGFLASFPTSMLKQGKHILTFIIITADRTGYYAPQQQIILDVK